MNAKHAIAAKPSARYALSMMVLATVAGCSLLTTPQTPTGTTDDESGPVALPSTLQVEPSTVVADGVSQARVIVTARAGINMPVQGAQVFIQADFNRVVVVQPSQPTDANGVATGMISSTQEGQATLFARIGDPNAPKIAAKNTVAFLPAPDKNALQAALQRSQATADLNDTISITIRGAPRAGLSWTGLDPNDLFLCNNRLDPTGSTVAQWRAKKAGPRSLVFKSGIFTTIANAQFAAGPVDVTRSRFVTATTQGAADGTTSIVATTLALDRYDNPVANAPVTMRLVPSLSGARLSPASGVTGADGTFECKVASIGVGASAIQASLASSTYSQPIAFVAGPTAVAWSSFAASPAAVADGNASVKLALQARDKFGHPVVGRAVSFVSQSAASPALTYANRTGVTDASGQANVVVRSTRAGATTIAAYIDMLPMAADATFVAGPLNAGQSGLAITPNVAIAGTAPLVAKAQLADTFANPLTGVAVQFVSSNPALRTVNTTATSDVAGVAAISLASTTAGNYNVIASCLGTAFAAQVRIAAGPPDAAASSLTLQASNVLADGNSAVPMVLTVRDAYSNPIPNYRVQWASSTPNDVFSVGNGNTDAGGVLTTSMTSTVAGAHAISAQLGAIAMPAVALFVAGPLDGNRSSIAASPASLVADATAASSIVLQARDAYGNGIAGASFRASWTGSGAQVVPTLGVTDASGNASARATGRVAGVQTLQASLGNGNVVVQVPLTFVAGPPTLAASSLTVSPQPVAADNVSRAAVRLALRDAFANPVQNAAVALSLPGASTWSGPVAGVTDGNGMFASSVSSPLAGTRFASATAGALVLNANVQFEAGTAAAPPSALTFSPAAVVANNVATMQVSVALRDALSNPIANAPLGLSVSGAGNTLGQATGVSDANGLFTTTLRSQAAGAKQLSVNLSSGLSLSGVASFVAAIPAAATSTLTPSPNTAVAGAPIALQVVIRDSAGNLVPAASVLFTSSNGGDAFDPNPVTTNAVGAASATVSSLVAGSRVLQAVASGASLQTTITFVAATPNDRVTQLVVAPSTQQADGTSAVAIMVQAFDAAANPMPNQAVSLATNPPTSTDAFAPPQGFTDSQGIFTSRLRATLSGTRIVQATLNGNVLSAPVTWLAGTPNSAASTLESNPAVVYADNAAAATLRVTARDAFANAVPGASVAYFASGTANHFAAGSGVTDANGQCTTTLKSTSAQIKLVTASLGTAAAAQLNVTFIPGGVYPPLCTIALSPNAIVADGSVAAAANVVTRDAQSNLISGIAVGFSAAANVVFAAPAATSDASGRATTTLSSTKAGTVSVSTTVDGLPGPAATLLLLAGPPKASASSMSLSPNSVVADGNAQATASVVLRDARGNLVAGQMVSWSSVGTTATIANATTTTDATGRASATVSSRTAEAVVVTAAFNADTMSASQSFVAGPPAASASALSIGPNSLVADDTAVASIVATVRDALGNGVPNTAILLRASNANDTIVSPSGITDAAGKLTTSLHTKQAGTRSVGFALPGGNVTATFAAAAGSPNSARSSLAFVPSVQVADNASTIAVACTVRDQFLNPVPGAPVSIVSSNANDVLAMASGTADANGTYSTTLRSGVAEQKLITATSGPAVVAGNVVFSYGAPSSAQSTLAISPNAVVANAVAQATVAFRVADALGNPLANQPVSLALSAGLGTFAQAAGNTDSNGVYTTALRSSKAEIKTVAATAGPATRNANATFTPGPPAAPQSTFAISPNAVATNGNSATWTAMLRDAFGNAVANANLVLSSSGANVAIAPTSAQTDAQGSAAGTVSSTTSQRTSLLATNASATLSAPVSFYVAGMPVAAYSSLTAAPSTPVANGVATTTITATLMDGGHNPVAATAVSLSSPPTQTLLAAAFGFTGTTGVYATTMASRFAGTKPIVAQFSGGPLVGSATYSARALQCGQVPLMGTFPSLPSAPKPDHIVVADFNADGCPDVAYLSIGARAVYAGLCQPGLQYSVTPLFSVGANTDGQIAALDYDGDGDLDIAYASSVGGFVTLYQNDGHAAFSLRGNTTIAPNVTALAAADFNGDHKQDLAAVGPGSNSMAVMLSTASGLGPVTTYPLGGPATSVAAADLNQDGNIDLVAVDRSTGMLSALLNDGAGHFAVASSSPILSAPEALVLGDLTGDGYIDVVTASGGNVQINAGTNDGHFAAATTRVLPFAGMASSTRIAVVDLDLDGNNDLIVGVANAPGNAAAVLLNAGGGALQSPVVYRGQLGNSGGIAIGDLTRDGKLDVLIGSLNTIDVLAGDGHGKLFARQTMPTPGLVQAALADVDNDGNVDLIGAMGASETAVVWLGNGAAGFTAGPTISFAGLGSVVHLAVADVDGDSRPDIMAALPTSNRVGVAKGAGGSAFASPTTAMVVPSPVWVAIGDIDGDGKLDIAAALSGNAMAVGLGLGNAAFAAPSMTALPDSPYALRLADFNGDGLLDAFVSMGTAGASHEILLQRANGSFAAGAVYSAATAGTQADIVDLDGDGLNDVVLGNDAAISLFRGDGAGALSLWAQSSPAAPPVLGRSGFAVADINGDSWPDIISAGSGGGLAVSLGAGAGAPPSYTYVFPYGGQNMGNAAAADLNGDGKPDIVLWGADGVAVMPNIGCWPATSPF